MRRSSTLFSALLALFAIAQVAAASDRWFVEPSNEAVSYTDLVQASQPLRLRVTIEWIVNGYPNTNQNLVLGLTRESLLVLERSGLVEPSRGAIDGSMAVRLVTGDARSPVFDRRGPGARARWVHRLKVEIRTGDEVMHRDYEGAILIYRGRAESPRQLAPVEPARAHAELMEQLLLRALYDFQRQGILPAS